MTEKYCDDGYVFCKCYKHYKTGKMVYKKDGGYFKFPRRKK